MPTVTWQTLRHEIARNCGGFYEFDTTTNITTDTDIVSTELAERFSEDDYFNGWYVMVEDSDSNNDGEIRRVTDYVASTGTLTAAGANFSSDSEAVTCGLYIKHPDDLKRAYNNSRGFMYPYVRSVRDVESVATGIGQNKYTVPTSFTNKPLQVRFKHRPSADSIDENLLQNPSFEDWSSGGTDADNWTATNLSIAEFQANAEADEFFILGGSRSGKITTQGNAEETLVQTLNISTGKEPNNLAGVRVSFSMWVYMWNEPATSVVLYVDAANTESGSDEAGNAHTGTGWERLTVTTTIGSAESTITLGLKVSSSGTNVLLFVDEAIATIGGSLPYEGKETILQNWDWIPPVDGASNSGHVEIHYPLPKAHALRMIGTDILSSVSADTDTIEITEAQMYGVALKVCANLLGEEAGLQRDSAGRNAMREEALQTSAIADNELMRTRAQVPVPALQIHDWTLV